MQSPLSYNQQQLATAFDNWKREVTTNLLLQWLDNEEKVLFNQARALRRSDPEKSLDILTETRAIENLRAAIKTGSFLPTLKQTE